MLCPNGLPQGSCIPNPHHQPFNSKPSFPSASSQLNASTFPSSHSAQLESAPSSLGFIQPPHQPRPPSYPSYPTYPFYSHALPSAPRSLYPSSYTTCAPPPGMVYAFAKMESMHPSVPSFFFRCLKVVLGTPTPSEPCDVDTSTWDPQSVSKRITIQYHFLSQSFELTMHSSSGVYINNQPVEKNMTVSLKHRTQLQIGVVRFLFLLPQPTHPEEVYRSYITSADDLPEPPPFDMMIREILQHQQGKGMTVKDLCKAMIRKYPQTRLHCGWQHTIRKLLQRSFKKVSGGHEAGGAANEELWALC